MRKRPALAQMLILGPQILLMDEPFSALDIQTRQLMENELLELWSANRKSVVFITHDLEEAISLSDRVVVLSAGPATRPIGEFAIDLPRPRDVAEAVGVVVTDMTEARRSEEMLRSLTRRVVQVQETERGRVAVELHDRIWHSMKEEVLKGYAQTRNRVAS
jgi:NitT/TauT family transport system ATP-binding protein